MAISASIVWFISKTTLNCCAASSGALGHRLLSDVKRCSLDGWMCLSNNARIADSVCAHQTVYGLAAFE